MVTLFAVLLLLPSLPQSVFAQPPSVISVNFTKNDSTMLFNGVLNTGATNPALNDQTPSQAGHWRNNYQDASTGKTLGIAYFLSSDQSVRIECQASNFMAGFGFNAVDCSLQADPSKTAAGTVFSPGEYKNSTLITFSNAGDIDALYGAIRSKFMYVTSETVSTSNSAGISSVAHRVMIRCAMSTQLPPASCSILIVNP